MPILCNKSVSYNTQLQQCHVHQSCLSNCGSMLRCNSVLTPATPLHSSWIFHLLKTDMEWRSTVLFHGINQKAWMYDSGRSVSAARSPSQQNCDMRTVLQAYNLLMLWNFHTDTSPIATYPLIHLNTSLLFCFQCSWYNEQAMDWTSQGPIPGKRNIFLSSKMLQMALVPSLIFNGYQGFFPWD